VCDLILPFRDNALIPVLHCFCKTTALGAFVRELKTPTMGFTVTQEAEKYEGIPDMLRL
jgi:hypothetical protein